MENREVVNITKAGMWLGEDGIVRIMWIPGAEVTLEDAEESMAAYLQINQGKRRPMVVDTSQMKSLAREARHLYASEEAAKVASAVGLIVGTPVSRVLGNFYLGLSNPHLPTRLFDSESEALEWLKGYIE
ncbi:MAG: hypothetical protein FD157_1995 [Rhodocyclaceae bacterium]|nr:MAG: hypothetical protein FD157_1995 [Rhodocyclaceae bacterium]TND00927.1 MAG: hypothetical protein FD118_2717 [Rhodocyclaceae bacterium]